MRLSKLTDEDLAVYMQQADGKGIEEIIDRYEGPLLRYVSYLTKDNDMSQDIVQETFLSVYQNINSFNSKRKFSSWIYRIAHNKAINDLRKISKIFALGDREVVDERSDVLKTNKNIDLEKTEKMLDKAIKELPLKYKEAIILRYFEDKSYEEISDICYCPVSTVGVRIKRAHELLKSKLNIENIEEYL